VHESIGTAGLPGGWYQQGLSSYLEVVDAQRVALQAERLDVQLRGQRAVSTILLAKSLGGGWERLHMNEVATSE
jgi:multidrug efflux system outer membrane protein